MIVLAVFVNANKEDVSISRPVLYTRLRSPQNRDRLQTRPTSVSFVFIPRKDMIRVLGMIHT